MRLGPDQVEAHLAKQLAPAYLIHGDEPLLLLESADAVRAAARKRGHVEREVFFVERGFDWSAFRQATASQSLFGEKKIVELRLATGKPAAAAAEALENYCADPSPDAVLIVTMPKPEGSGWWKAGWFTALERAGAVIEAAPIKRAQLPQWIAQRLGRQRQRASQESLEFLADRVEGNLLAAQQEVLKLGLLAPEGELSHEQVAGAVASVARYDYDTLADALFAGNFAQYARALAGLRGEGESPAGLIWRLGDELVALSRIKQQMAGGRTLDKLLLENRVWRSAQPRFENGLRRLDAARMQAAVAHAARIERASKGVGDGEPWDELLALGLELRHGEARRPGRSAAAR